MNKFAALPLALALATCVPSLSQANTDADAQIIADADAQSVAQTDREDSRDWGWLGLLGLAGLAGLRRRDPYQVRRDTLATPR